MFAVHDPKHILANGATEIIVFLYPRFTIIMYQL